MNLYNFLRVPPIFIIDELFKRSFDLSEFTNVLFPASNIFVNSSEYQNEYSLFYNAFLPFVKIIVTGLIFSSSFCLFVLPAKYLQSVYFNIFSVCLILLSYWTNIQSLSVLLEKIEIFETDLIFKLLTWDFNSTINILIQLQVVSSGSIFLRNIILQCFLSLIFYFLQVFTKNHPVHKVFTLSFIIPSLIILIPCTHGILNTIVILATMLPFFVKLKTLWLNMLTVINLIRDGYNHSLETINNYGYYTFIEMEWNRLNIPIVLRIFWAIRVMEQILNVSSDIEIKNEIMNVAVKYLLIKGCDTFTAILGMTSFVSFFCHYIGSFFCWVLLGYNINDIHIEIISAGLFFGLAEETRLTRLEPEERLIRLYKNACLLCAVPWYFIHNKLNPFLISLNASSKPSINRHLRALLVCGFLIVLPTALVMYLWTHCSISSWLLIVSSFNIEIIIQVLVSLVVYSLFSIDSCCQIHWEKLDDYIYYIKSFGIIVGFCFGLCVFLCDVYITLYPNVSETFTTVRFVLYFILLQDAKHGWRIFIKRCTAMRKIESLSDATPNQLAQLDDVCSICYQNMVSAKITQCNHYFHGVCLRKWLYIEDRCPLCHYILYQTES